MAICSSVLSLTLLYIVIARSVCDVPAHRSVVLRHAGVAILERDSFASLGMTHGRLFVGQYARLWMVGDRRMAKTVTRHGFYVILYGLYKPRYIIAFCLDVYLKTKALESLCGHGPD